MLVRIDYTVLNTDRITKIAVDPDGKYVVVYFSPDDSQRFEFPHSESQGSFLRRLGVSNFA